MIEFGFASFKEGKITLSCSDMFTVYFQEEEEMY